MVGLVSTLLRLRICLCYAAAGTANALHLDFLRTRSLSFSVCLRLYISCVYAFNHREPSHKYMTFVLAELTINATDITYEIVPDY